VMTCGERLTDAQGHVYSARVPASHPATDYTPRIIPNHPEAEVPLEAAQILWQRKKSKSDPRRLAPLVFS
jgi:hypothetical protein